MSWDLLGALWEHFGSILGHPGAYFGALWVLLELFVEHLSSFLCQNLEFVIVVPLCSETITFEGPWGP